MFKDHNLKRSFCTDNKISATLSGASIKKHKQEHAGERLMRRFTIDSSLRPE